ncbi:serine aminopeptidase S33 family [Caldicellulosiruptor bescii]|uniref:Dipeptidyl aminopeptidase/acylaminoacyl-peptidase-like protein n=2 Tax=Caldicellulosiruptor bescii TaxID=31899 RepID=B9MQW1_CALBD|nr:alpha/beta fold hydrolase [Caldicellulosiruptor bescii]ACM60065.1 dipeptidyl aminopeptidase/acylaminoacyl-peptidase-like protein [Caldicellulosiruptor bescii DSM 6725]PBC87478.1 serine aminopeptidase S33 family [Caldicellulosiruptor bescii]PBC90411.1 serine aminopeptidase S33 family [Caldicellulosiruptor bescii]PBD04157.1 serine aminopeptidase S33 family [Caldicellulosiruptor bescii]PBD06208.1 serine aminopeptidase S33 family [Caldicellulosiruptor bescii]
MNLIAKTQKNKNKIIAAILFIILISFSICLLITTVLYSQAFKRCTSKDDKVYSLVKKYPDLIYKRVQFKSNAGQMLRGYIYYKKNNIEAKKGLIVVSHGFGGTHINYLDEINYFTDKGYYVLGFDNTGCGESERDSMIGLPQAVADLDYALRFIEKNNEFKNMPILLFGHSWGGYAVCAVLSYSHKIAGVVSCAGFNSPYEIVKTTAINSYGLWGKVILPYLSLLGKIKFSKLANITALDGIKKSSVPLLVIHSKDDDTVKLENSIFEACKHLNKTNVSLKLFDSKGHDIFLSDNALKYIRQKRNEFKELTSKYGSYKKIPKKILKDFQASINSKLMSEIDQDMMEQIVEFFDNAIELQKNRSM